MFSNFNVGAATRSFVGRKASRQIEVFLNNYGADNLKLCIENKVWLTDYLPADYKAVLKQKCHPYVDMLPAFSNTDVYDWIPQKHRTFIEALPGGKEWALGQLQVIREYLTS